MNKERFLECVADDQVKPISDEQIAEVEQALHLRFPADFKRFIARWNYADFGCYNNFRLADITDLSYLKDPDYVPEAEAWAKDFGGSFPDWGDDFPDIAPSEVDLFGFADDGGESEYYLMIDKKDPERYWIFEVAEGDLMFCVDSVSAFLDRMLATDEDVYFDYDGRTLKQKLADRIYGGRLEKPSRRMAGSLDDVPRERVPEKPRIDGHSFAAILPTGELLPMTNLPADADGTHQFWISDRPVPNGQFLPWNALVDSKLNRDDPAIVSAADAEMFCAILNDYFAESLPDGYAFALPSEAEYQRALKHVSQTVEKAKKSVSCSLLKLFVRPNPAPARPPEVLMRDCSAVSASGTNPEKLPFYLVLTEVKSSIAAMPG